MPLRPEDVQEAVRIQTLAAHSPEKQVRLVAGPGSGKSSTIEERTAWLLRREIDPHQIAVVSFTNASVKDLRLRLQAHCARNGLSGIKDVSITTLHSIALRLLRRAGLLAFYPTRPMVLDDWELEHIYDAEFGEAQQIPSKQRREAIRRYYEALWSTGRENAVTYVPPDPPITDDERARFTAFHQPTAQVYSAVLPGEIVQKCIQAAATGVINIAELLGITQLIVDEYQDLNPADLDFIDALARAGVTVFVAGDDDQSIYSFRHASPLGIQRFAEKYPGAGLHALHDCFRCTPAALGAATTLMLNNAPPDRIAKALISLYRTADPPNQGVVYRWRFFLAKQESTAIADSCGSLIAEGVKPKEIAILLASRRAGAGLWSEIRSSLQQATIPFDPPKEEGFADSNAGRLVLSIARVVCSRDQAGAPQDLIAHRTLLGMVKGVGLRTTNAIRKAVITTPNVSFRALFYDDLPEGVLATRARQALLHAREICSTIRAWQPMNTLGERGAQIAEIVRNAIDNESKSIWQDFLEPLPREMMISELQDYLWADHAQQRQDILRAIAVRLGTDPEALPHELDRVKVMTMHGAKGLAAQVVFVPGLEQGLLPNSYQSPYPAQLLEAARLLYVSITRARAACVLSFAARRTVNGDFETQQASQFATQTGGTFVTRKGGLTPEETANVLAAIGGL